MKPIIAGPFLDKSSLCEPILRSLPQWFGMEESNIQYLKDIDRFPTFLAYLENHVCGFLTLKLHNPFSAEIHVMGVHPALHHQGIGKALANQAERYLFQQGFQYVQVKTLGDSDPDENYARTRSFYLAMGFKPLEETNRIWGAQNPCLILVKCLHH